MKMFFLTFFLIPLQCFCANISDWIFIDIQENNGNAVFLFFNRESGLFSAHESCELVPLEEASFMFANIYLCEENYAIIEAIWMYPEIYYPVEICAYIQDERIPTCKTHHDP